MKISKKIPSSTIPSLIRPLSPHLQIYRPQLTSVLSILHRLTGVGLAIGHGVVVLWLLAIASGPQWFELCRTCCAHPLGKVFLMGMSFSYFYHLFSGLRHLVWDSGHGFDLKSVYQSGYVVLILTGIATLLTWSFLFGWL
jgi:succinate dehydrogenase / fumarate reductase cytochrome b subunit